jgi:hypothetical protein
LVTVIIDAFAIVVNAMNTLSNADQDRYAPNHGSVADL